MCMHVHTHTHTQNIPLSKYPLVFQQSLETDIFSEIVTILHKDYVR